MYNTVIFSPISSTRDEVLILGLQGLMMPGISDQWPNPNGVEQLASR